MNGRINELADQAGFCGTGDALNKFAELIIRECREVSLKNSHREDDMGAIIARQIKEHFGVK